MYLAEEGEQVMKITIYVPETTVLIFANYAYAENDGTLMMGVKQIASHEIEDGAEFTTQALMEEDE